MWLKWISLIPLLAAQAIYVKSTALKLPGATGDTSGMIAGDEPALRLLVIGDSVAAGAGIATFADALVGQIASSLHGRTQRSIHWQVIGKIGVTLETTYTELLPLVADSPLDVIVISQGVNDTTHLHLQKRYEQNLIRLIDALQARTHHPLIILPAVPRLEQFPVLPYPLRTFLGERVRVLDSAAEGLTLPNVQHVPFPEIPVTPEYFCEDGFHPGIKACAMWGGMLADAIVQRLADDLRNE